MKDTDHYRVHPVVHLANHRSMREENSLETAEHTAWARCGNGLGLERPQRCFELSDGGRPRKTLRYAESHSVFQDGLKGRGFVRNALRFAHENTKATLSLV